MQEFFIGLGVFSFFIVIGLIGVHILLKSPTILRMNRIKNSCTKETKYIWQKKYKIKTLCKLSEVKKAFVPQEILSPTNTLYLKLKQRGTKISVFSATSNIRFLSSSPEFDQMKNTINHFLDSNDKECIIKLFLPEFGIVYIGISLFGLLFLLFAMFY